MHLMEFLRSASTSLDLLHMHYRVSAHHLCKCIFHVRHHSAIPTVSRIYPRALSRSIPSVDTALRLCHTALSYPYLAACHQVLGCRFHPSS
jgi:hypothetical protein